MVSVVAAIIRIFVGLAGAAGVVAVVADTVLGSTRGSRWFD